VFIVRRLLLYAIPALLIFLSNDKFEIEFSTDSKKDDIIKLLLFGISCIISYVIVPYYTERDKSRVQKLSNSVKVLLGSMRKEVSTELEKYFVTHAGGAPKKDLKLSIRVFLPKRRTIKDLWYGRRYFVLKSYDGLETREIEQLAFQVSPKGKEQGLVGQVYIQKSIKYDFDLYENHSLDFYRLNPNQLETTNYCNFAIAAPIFKGNSQNVVAIITFDSETKVYHTRGKGWEDTIRTYCKIIQKIQKSLK